MRNLFAKFSSPHLTPLLVTPAAVLYVITLVVTGGQTIMLSQGVDVLAGGVSLPEFFAANAWARLYFALVVAHVLARLVRTSLREARTPDPQTVDAEEILSHAGAYTVVIPAREWVERVSESIAGSWYAADEAGTRAILWSGPPPVLRRLWRYALWLMLFGALVSVSVRQATYLQLGDGEALSAPVVGNLYRYDWRFPAPGVTVPVAGQVLGVVDGSAEPSLDASGQLVPSGYLARPIVADVVLGGPDSASKKVAMWPPTVFAGRFVSIVDMGVAPHVVVTRAGTKVSDAYLKSKLTPGLVESDIIRPESVPFSIELTLIPGSSPVPNAVLYARAIEGTSSVMTSGTISPDRPLAVGEYAVAIPEARWWVGLSIASDIGLWIFFVGSVLLLAALVVRLWVFAAGSERYEMVVVDTENGERLYIGADATFGSRGRAARRLRHIAHAASGREQEDGS